MPSRPPDVGLAAGKWPNPGLYFHCHINVNLMFHKRRGRGGGGGGVSEKYQNDDLKGKNDLGVFPNQVRILHEKLHMIFQCI